MIKKIMLHLMLSLIFLAPLSGGDTLDVSQRQYFSSVFNVEKLGITLSPIMGKLIIYNNSEEEETFFFRTRHIDSLLWNGARQLSLIDKDGYLFYRLKVQAETSAEVCYHLTDVDNAELYYLDETSTENTLFLMQKSRGKLNYFVSFFGISLFCFLGFIHLFNFFVIKKREYIYYSIYLFALTIYFYFKYFYSVKSCFLSDCDSPYELYISALIQPVFHSLYVQFVREFLESKTRYPLYDKVAKGYIIFSTFSIGLLAILSFYSTSWFASYFDIYRIIVILISFWMIYHIARRWDRLNIFIIIGSSLLVIFAIFAMVFSIIAHYPWGWFPITLMLVGTILEVLLFSAGLSYKAFRTGQEKLQIERDLNKEKTKTEKILRDREQMISKDLYGTRLELELEKKEQLKSAIYLTEKENEIEILLLQMNPHFIFNSMNSLKRYVLLGDKTEAVSHLEKMSDFIRRVLNQSRCKLITLRDELATIQLYFDLESERLSDPITLNMDYPKLIELDQIMIPPMLIQPFVENAIWHGLASSKILPKTITVSIREENRNLLIEILDNGIGRKASYNNDQKQHKSLATEITRKRISLLNNGQPGLQITDLYSSGSSPTGTKVSIKLHSY